MYSFFFFFFCSSSPLRYLVTPAVKNLLPVFDELSWKSLEKRPKFPHVNTEGGWQIWVLFFVSISISGFRLIFIELPLLYLPKHSYGKNVFWKIFSGVLNFCSLTCHGLMGGGGECLHLLPQPCGRGNPFWRLLLDCRIDIMLTNSTVKPTTS